MGNDHAGYPLRSAVREAVVALGHELVDFGSATPEACDYPDVVVPLTQAILRGECELGILFCGTGIGMCIAANKVPGIRAALAPDELSARLSRSHNDANVLCLSADLIGQTLVKRIVDLWLTTPFDGGRHQRRLGKIQLIERGVNPAEGAAGIDLAPGS